MWCDSHHVNHYDFSTTTSTVFYKTQVWPRISRICVKSFDSKLIKIWPLIIWYWSKIDKKRPLSAFLVPPNWFRPPILCGYRPICTINSIFTSWSCVKYLFIFEMIQDHIFVSLDPYSWFSRSNLTLIKNDWCYRYERPTLHHMIILWCTNRGSVQLSESVLQFSKLVSHYRTGSN